jgi:hypothetical protein
MTDSATPGRGGSDRTDDGAARRRALIFGDVLPDQTEDERTKDSRLGSDEAERDDDIRRDVPPHY